MRAHVRGWLAGLLLLCGLVPASAAGDFPPTATFSDVRVDVRPLRDKGAGLQADALAADLNAALRKTFAGRIGGGGPRLVVVVTALSLRPYVGGGALRGRGGNFETDYLEGEALLVGRNGQVLGRHPQMTATPSSYGGAWYAPDFEARRLAAIADIYAQWLARDLPRN
ncbi:MULTISPECIES: hypothetical protein [Methylobacterium]|jgi:hypothetical protein|uniref:hypothetical protein n=1 Tax=Methylobacterium TaxID=407 RepID=UPI0011C88D77|nr:MULTISPECIES: hypothetical protein [Methylobacterium]TXN47263.1 hypothetical protein FV233_05430 [Methylobacterium sp. WL7]TXN73071.1 hypothetical protein FV228_08725 [Methylobacterium sp. WL18]GJE23843.1 hypothetical protein JHFBIEKO_4307 [Methylobacterium mesophilicum]